jgi:hypothetical protein
VRRNVNADTPLPPEIPYALNPLDGAIADYWLGPAADQVALDILDSTGAVARHYPSVPITPVAEAAQPPHPNFWQHNGDWAPTPAMRAAYVSACRDLSAVQTSRRRVLTEGVSEAIAVLSRNGAAPIQVPRAGPPPRCWHNCHKHNPAHSVSQQALCIKRRSSLDPSMRSTACYRPAVN